MKRLSVFLFSIILILSCKKDAEPQSSCTDGTIINGGNPAVDGLGWYIKGTDGKTYIPENLPEPYKIDSLRVSVCFYPTGEKFYCMCAAPLDVYHITSIDKR